nr:MAG TPA: hypothetical protein [Caudoviricetes sp.]
MWKRCQRSGNPLTTRKTPKAPSQHAINSDKMPPLDTPPGEGVFYRNIVKFIFGRIRFLVGKRVKVWYNRTVKLSYFDKLTI